MQETWLQFLGWEDPLEKGTATHSNILAWRIPGTIQSIISSVQTISHVWLFVTAWTAAARPPCPSPTPRVYTNSCPLSQWCHPTLSSSVVPFSFLLQFFPGSGSFQMSQFFASGQSIGIFSSLDFAKAEVLDFQLWILQRPKYWTFSFSISPSNVYVGLISFRWD